MCCLFHSFVFLRGGLAESNVPGLSSLLSALCCGRCCWFDSAERASEPASQRSAAQKQQSCNCQVICKWSGKAERPRLRPPLPPHHDRRRRRRRSNFIPSDRVYIGKVAHASLIHIPNISLFFFFFILFFFFFFVLLSHSFLPFFLCLFYILVKTRSRAKTMRDKKKKNINKHI
jgi:hypothetical protein